MSRMDKDSGFKYIGSTDVKRKRIFCLDDIPEGMGVAAVAVPTSDPNVSRLDFYEVPPFYVGGCL